MGQIGEMLTATTVRVMGLAEGLLKGVEPAVFASQPTQDGRVVDTNHGAFVYGHLALYPAKILQMLGQDPGPAACSERYAELFAAGVHCKHDPDNAEHPPMAEIVERFKAGSAAAIEAVRGADDAVFARPIEGNDRYREVFGTVGNATGFLLHDHVMFHLGQMSAWRRMMGLGSAM